MIDVTVLVVDDDELLRRALADLLKDAGYLVLLADTGAKALAKARTRPRIDVLLTDIGLPDMCGRALARAFAAQHPKASTLFMSGVDDQRGQLLLKPFRPDELLAALGSAVRKPSP